MADGMPNESMVAQTPAKSEKDSEKPSSTKAKAAPKTAPKEKAKNNVIKKSTQAQATQISAKTLQATFRTRTNLAKLEGGHCACA